ncbi:hypothetical protein FQA47_016910 [Oryzias melastigma]|uniref:Uncharacterized protein n=1 Tax=Oryzias melastigma TaxID=30732 RepID=A0A834FQQ3_ORYME|nr:hypothetical protein FQA47_016910 [Oryzias melastigma]
MEVRAFLCRWRLTNTPRPSSTRSPRIAPALASSARRKNTHLSLSPVFYLCLSPAPSPPAGRPLARSRQLQRSVCLHCRSSVSL